MFKNPDPRKLRWLSFAVFAFAVTLALWQSLVDPIPKLRHPATLSTAWLSFALWAGSCGLILQVKPGEWTPGAARFEVTRTTWLLGAILFFIHVGFAFHFGHRWRHSRAFDHVQETSGFGPGIFVSYFFLAIWLADALWFALYPKSYSTRPRWLGIAVHAFLGFILFNGAVVYVGNPMRWLGALVFTLLLGFLLVKVLRERANGRPKPSATRVPNSA